MVNEPIVFGPPVKSNPIFSSVQQGLVIISLLLVLFKCKLLDMTPIKRSVENIIEMPWSSFGRLAALLALPMYARLV